MQLKTVKSVRQLIIVCSTMFVLTQFACAQTDSQTPSSSLLDDLLNPSPEKTNDAGQGTGGKAVRTLAEELNAVSGQMDSAAVSLSASNEVNIRSVEQALKYQQEAIDALNRLLQKNGAKMSSQSGGDKGAANKQSGAKEPGQPKNSPSGEEHDDKESPSPAQDPQSGDKSGEQSSQSRPNSTPKQNDHQDSSAKTNGQDAQGLPTKETVVDLLKSIESSGSANWGKLPQRLRDQMQNSSSLEFTRGYEQQTRDYFQKLNDALLKIQKTPTN